MSGGEEEVEGDALIIPLESLRWAVSDSGGIKLGKKSLSQHVFVFFSRVRLLCFSLKGSGVRQRNILRHDDTNQKEDREGGLVRGGNSLNLQQSS